MHNLENTNNIILYLAYISPCDINLYDGIVALESIMEEPIKT
jgi:hypothetical protein